MVTRDVCCLQEQEAELQSGALDGLSSADMTAVVDELSGIAARVKSLVIQAVNRLSAGTAAPAWLQSSRPFSQIPGGSVHASCCGHSD